jgi:hypothetical protein
MTPRRSAAALLAGLLLLAGCGVRSDESARELAAENVPFGLLEDASATTTTTEASAPRSRVLVYLVRDERLEPQPRQVDERTPQAVVRSLLGEISAEEDAAGFRTAIPVDTQVREVRPSSDGSSWVVDLSDEFLSISGSQQIKALAQVVCTLTAQRLDGIRIAGVRFAFEGQPQEVLNGQSQHTGEPLTCASYAPLPVGLDPPPDPPPAATGDQ